MGMTPVEASTYIGIQADQRLSPCPPMPNSVGSGYPEDKKHHLAPFPYEGGEDSAISRIKAIIQSSPGVSLVSETALYLHYEVRAGYLGWIDDVEFLVNPHDQVIHFRSASRHGYWDMGRNARRLRRIRQIFDRIPV